MPAASGTMRCSSLTLISVLCPCSAKTHTPIPMLEEIRDAQHSESYVNHLRHAKAKYESLAKFIVWLATNGQAPPAANGHLGAHAAVPAAALAPAVPPVAAPQPVHANGGLEAAPAAAASASVSSSSETDSSDEHPPAGGAACAAAVPANHANGDGEPGPSRRPAACRDDTSSYVTASSTVSSSA